MDEKNNIMNKVDKKMNGCKDEWIKKWMDEWN